MRPTFTRCLMMLLITTTVTSCSYLTSSTSARNRNKEYLTARSIAPINVPPGISSSAFSTTYPVSNRPYYGTAVNISLIPPGLKGSAS